MLDHLDKRDLSYLGGLLLTAITRCVTLLIRAKAHDSTRCPSHLETCSRSLSPLDGYQARALTSSADALAVAVFFIGGLCLHTIKVTTATNTMNALELVRRQMLRQMAIKEARLVQLTYRGNTYVKQQNA